MHNVLLPLSLLVLLPLTLAQFGNFFPFGQNPFSGGQQRQAHESQQSSGWRAHKGWAEYESGKLLIFVICRLWRELELMVGCGFGGGG